MKQHVTHETASEYWADGFVHLAGVISSLIAAGLLASNALNNASPLISLSLLAYCFGLIATFAFSAAYNMAISPAPKALLRKFDRSAIFVMIAGTYTPLGLIGIGPPWGNWLVAINWGIAIIGVIATMFFAQRFERLSLALYMIQGWLVVLALKPMFETLSFYAFMMIIVGGLTYCAGVIFHRRDDWKYNRAIWHCFVLCAATMHYFAILDIARLS